jgi:tetratricopeptide (TPR) repeat protein
MRPARTYFVAVALALLAALRAGAPLTGQAQARTIKGAVKDGSGSPVPGATVTLRSESTSRSTSVVTQPDGSYVFPSLEAGAYTVEAIREGFEKSSRAHVTLGAQPQTVDLILARRDAAPNKDKDRPDGLDPALGRAEYSDQPQFKPGELADPSAAGGYSDSLATTRKELVRDYLAPRDLGDSDRPETGSSEIAIYLSGSQLLARQAFAPAIEVFTRGVERYPSSERLEMGLGTALYARGQYEQAVRALLAAVDLAPSDPRAYVFLAKAYNASRAHAGAEAEEVIKRLERYTQLEPQNPRAHYYYAMALGSTKRREKAGPDELDEVEAELRKAIALDPRLADARLELGNLYADRARYADAIREYRQAIRLQPDLAAAHYRLGQAYRRAGDKDRAREQFDAYERLRKPPGGLPKTGAP